MKRAGYSALFPSPWQGEGQGGGRATGSRVCGPTPSRRFASMTLRAGLPLSGGGWIMRGLMKTEEPS